jgi:hypothetical protein
MSNTTLPEDNVHIVESLLLYQRTNLYCHNKKGHASQRSTTELAHLLANKMISVVSRHFNFDYLP